MRFAIEGFSAFAPIELCEASALNTPFERRGSAKQARGEELPFVLFPIVAFGGRWLIHFLPPSPILDFGVYCR